MRTTTFSTIYGSLGEPSSLQWFGIGRQTHEFGGTYNWSRLLTFSGRIENMANTVSERLDPEAGLRKPIIDMRNPRLAPLQVIRPLNRKQQLVQLLLRHPVWGMTDGSGTVHDSVGELKRFIDRISLNNCSTPGIRRNSGIDCLREKGRCLVIHR